MISAIVLGASGFIGTRLVRRLAEAGVAVEALDIVDPRERLDGVVYRNADVREPIDFPGEAPVDAIYNLAALHRTPGHSPNEYYETNVLGAFNATALAERLACPTMVFTSSISVYGPSEDRITEASPLRPTSDYGHSKRIAERVHRMWLNMSDGRRLVTVRPGVVFGPGEGGNFTRLARALKRGLFAYPGRKTTVKSGGHVDDLLSAIDFALGRREREITFNYAYPEEVTTEGIVRAFSDVAGYSARHPVLPIGLMMAAARVCEGAQALGISTPVHRDRVMKLVQSTRIAPDWLQANGYHFRSNLTSALERWRDETGGQFC
jgi:nucleoside-diphosphate-sugar epimerase